jgi:A/G-specific adenine glycosylase
MNIPLLRRQLLRWFEKHQRVHYPWRHTKNPYHILIAETFLQRTKANQVLPVYSKFIKVFPAPLDLAKANEDTIRELVYPLGLAWRGKNLKKTALDIIEKFNGSIPSNRKELLQIRGVGDYIADCIIYLAFGRRVSIMDSNVVRILGRLYGIKTHAESRRDKKFREFVDELLPKRAFRKFNLALLDLGALVCARNPECSSCPIRIHCRYFKNSS